MKTILIIAVVVLSSYACSEKGEKTVFINLTTTHGEITLQLFNETPGHRDNFVKLVEEGFYNDIKFHRIIEEFMCQVGSPSSRASYVEGADVSRYNYTIPAEIDTAFFHRKGAIAAARTGDNVNPLRNSSGTQFYIVQGKVWKEEELIAQVERINKGIRDGIYYKFLQEERGKQDSAELKLTPAEVQELAAVRANKYFESTLPYIMPEAHKSVYMTEGGSPHLDMNYTVFGQVVAGMDVIDKLAKMKDESGNAITAEKKILKAVIVKK
jgi:cyclophilin family peptidyl-prolyl cis-trans isomerase